MYKTKPCFRCDMPSDAPLNVLALNASLKHEAELSNTGELAELVLEVTGSGSEIVFDELPVDDPVKRRPDISRAVRELGWRPRIELRDGLARTADWYRAELRRGDRVGD